MARPHDIRPVVTPRGAPVEGEVTLTVTGLEPGVGVRIGFGSFRQNQGGFARSQAGPDGTLVQKVQVPSWAEVDRVHFFYVTADNQPRAFTGPFHVTDAEGTVRVAGRISTVREARCVELTGPENSLYELQGELGIRNPGDAVQIVGTIAAESVCGSEGVPVVVREVLP